MRRASRVDGNHAAIVAALRKMGCKVLSLAAIGNGCPDLLILDRRKRLALIEVKDGSKPPSARQLTPEQAIFHGEWPVTVVRSLEDLTALVKSG